VNDLCNGLNGSFSNGSSRLAEILGDGLSDGSFLLRLQDGDNIGKVLLGTSSASGVIVKHDLNLDTENTLTEKNVANSSINEVTGGLTGVDHETVSELHGLGTGGTELARDNNLATLGARLHDETEDTIASTTDSQAVEKLELDGLALGNGAKTTVLNTLGIELNGVLGELETLLDKGGQLADTATLLTENVLGVGGTDDDLSASRSDADFNTRVAILGKLTSEELVQFGVENTISNELLLKKVSRNEVRIKRCASVVG